ncbi:MAG: DUF262 domain-containing protein [Prevotella sp.]|nr:DUF262 domain-containing protein [Prevotella sp.]
MNNLEKFQDIFKRNLKMSARTVSISTLLSDRYLKRVKYDPYYQRNYVWENDKQSFFIESVLLGTEIPPIVFYKSGLEIEVVDGRQRFETLKRFVDNDITLRSKGLLELKALDKKTFSDLEDIQQTFLNTKIRIFEFEVVGVSDLDSQMEDRIKKEIFRRYNSGITPLKQYEVDNAKYDDDNVTEFFKNTLFKDSELFDIIDRCYLTGSNKQKADRILDMAAFLRQMLVIDRIPVTRLAGSHKSFYTDILYDDYVANLSDEEDITNVCKVLIQQVKDVSRLYETSIRTVYECLLWGIIILGKENVPFDYYAVKDKVKEHYDSKTATYQTESDHYYGNIVNRYTDTANFLKEVTGFDFKNYLRSSTFRSQIKPLLQTDDDVDISIEKLSSLRINKPSPASKPIDQILLDVASDYYQIRPSYQRQEKISVKKASSIIESILLGIKLPPIFVFVRGDGVREVVDGQQRLLSILGFLGKPYKDEDGQIRYSLNNKFRLQDLRILPQYNGKHYTDIIKEVEDTILDFDIDEIEIQHDLNPTFEPTDLFIRLNNKPYPIRVNTFEMWNSTADRDVVTKIKEVTARHSSWFYAAAPVVDKLGTRTDRMQNEELITILSYISYSLSKSEEVTKILGFYLRLNKFTCRLKTKSYISTLIENLSDRPSEKEQFLHHIDESELIIKNIGTYLLDNDITKEHFNDLLNVKDTPNFSRSNQDFYILWVILRKINDNVMLARKDEVKKDIIKMLSLLKNVDEIKLDEKYSDQYVKILSEITNKYNG